MLLGWLSYQDREDLVAAARERSKVIAGEDLFADSPPANLPDDAAWEEQEGQSASSSTKLEAAFASGSYAGLTREAMDGLEAIQRHPSSEQWTEVATLERRAAFLLQSGDPASLEECSQVLARLDAHVEAGNVEPTLRVRMEAHRFACSWALRGGAAAVPIPVVLASPTPFAETVLLDALQGGLPSNEAISTLFAWLAGRCELDSLPTATRVTLASFELQRGNSVNADALLRGVLAEEPMNRSAWSMYANVARSDGDGATAIQRYERLLEVFPGSTVAMSNLAELHEGVGDAGMASDYRRRLWERIPYHLEAAERWIETWGHDVTFPRERFLPYLPAAELHVLHANHLRRHREFSAARVLLDDDETFADAPDLTARRRMRARLLVELDRDTTATPTLLELAEEATSRYPDGSAFWRIRVLAAKRAGRPMMIRDSVQRASAHGVLDGFLAEQGVKLANMNAEDGVRLVEASPPSARRQTAEEWAAALSSRTSGYPTAEELRFLTWCDEHLHDAVELRERLADLHRRAGRPVAAVKVLERLLEQFPQRASAMAALAGILGKSDTPRARELYERVWQATGDLAAMRGLGDVAMRERRTDDARRCFWFALAHDPYDDVAMTNLALLEVDTPALAPFFHAALHAGLGGGTQHFAVSAVDVAVATRGKVHPNWVHVAKTRLNGLSEMPAFRDEEQRLRALIEQWTRGPSDANPIDLKRSDFRLVLDAWWREVFRSVPWAPERVWDRGSIPPPLSISALRDFARQRLRTLGGDVSQTCGPAHAPPAASFDSGNGPPSENLAEPHGDREGDRIWFGLLLLALGALVRWIFKSMTST
jgi:tetratricopeptide (TPR) repeat protein